MGVGQTQVLRHFPGIHQSVELVLQLLQLLFPLTHFLSLQLVPLGPLRRRHCGCRQYRLRLQVAATVGLVLLVEPELGADARVGSARAVSGGVIDVVAVI